MGKKKKIKQEKKERTTTRSTKDWIEYLERPRTIIGFFILLFILISILYQPLVYQNMEPAGGDIISGIGKTHQMKEWEKRTGHYPLWNPAMFAGMPMYHRFHAKVWSFDTLLNALDFLGDWRLWYFLAGALGIFLLIKFLGLSAAVGYLAALGYVLMPHFQALIIVGHFAKFRALMWMPWVLLTALMLIRKPRALNMLLFALALAMQFRTQHYQIMFYTLLLVLFVAVPFLYRQIKNGEWGAFGRTLIFGVLALVLMLLYSAQNLLSIKEYTPYSTRGGHAISLKTQQQDQKQSKGVGFDYATNWSYSVSEWWNLIIPKFHGGTSSERYTGNAVPQFKNRELPTYWGSMPFTQSYEYLGILIAFLALVGVFFRWKDPVVKSLTFLTILALLMSLGKHFAGLYKLFFYYVPYFDKFRVPMMILTLVMFNTMILAAYGASFLLEADWNRKEVRTRFFTLAGIFGFLLLLPLIFGSSFTLSQPGEAQRYGQQVLTMLKKVRLDMLRTSTLTTLFFFIVGIASILAYQKKWINRGAMMVAFLLVVTFDLFLLDSHYVKGKFIDPELAKQQHYRPTAIDQELLKDNSLYRVFPMGQLFQDTHWSYYYQSIGGYSPAKMQTIQELVDNCLYQSLGDGLPINWNVVNMLNVKYLIAQQPIQSPHLQPVASDSRKKLYAYRNLQALPRAFFVKNFQVIADGVKRLQMLNNSDFNPAETAILEQEPAVRPETPDTTSVTITTWEPEKIEMKTFSNRPALLVLSESFYPPGWYAMLDGKEKLPIYKTDHHLRSVVVPSGNHEIGFYFHPGSYYAGLEISLLSLIATYFALFIMLYQDAYRWFVRLVSKKKVSAS